MKTVIQKLIIVLFFISPFIQRSFGRETMIMSVPQSMLHSYMVSSDTPETDSVKIKNLKKHKCKLEVIAPRQKNKTMDMYEFRNMKNLEIICTKERDGCQWTVDSFQLVYVPLYSDPLLVRNVGSAFEPKILDLIATAKTGDLFHFEKINTHKDTETREGLFLTVKVKE